jgi:hypothetical protein
MDGQSDRSKRRVCRTAYRNNAIIGHKKTRHAMDLAESVRSRRFRIIAHTASAHIMNVVAAGSQARCNAVLFNQWSPHRGGGPNHASIHHMNDLDISLAI